MRRWASQRIARTAAHVEVCVSPRQARRTRAVFEGNIQQSGTPLVRRVNEMIRERSPFGSVPFFCECDAACFQTVWLDAFDYDAVTLVPSAALLARGHGLDHLLGAS